VAQDPDELVRNVGQRVSELRLTRGMTQERFAEAMGCSVQYVSRIEVGENLSLHTLVKIGNVLDVTVSELLEPPTGIIPEKKRGRPRKS